MEQPRHALGRIPEDAPTVSMDINLGKRYSQVDFDYEEFAKVNQVLDKERESPDTSDLHIVIGKKGATGVHGSFNSWDNEIHVYKSATKREKTANNTLIHELQHHNDIDPDYSHTKPYILAHKLRHTSPALSLSTTIPNSANVFREAYSETLQYAAISLSLGAIATTAIVIGGYNMNRFERRARKAAKKHRHEVIRFKPLQSE